MGYFIKSEQHSAYQSSLHLVPPTGETIGSSDMIQPELILLRENEFAFRQGEMPRGLFLVKSGVVKTVVNRELSRGRVDSPEFISRILGAGDYFGFKALIKGTAHEYFAKTLRPTELLLYPKELVESVMAGPPTLMRSLLSQLVKDLENRDRVSQLHYLASVQERIAYQILLLADKFGVPMEDGIHLNLRLSRNELAQLAGTINESLSRHLTDLKNEGVVALIGKEIIVKNRQALMEKSGNFSR